MPVITHEMIVTLCTVARSGMGPDGCARYVGIAPETLTQWVQRGHLAARVADDGGPVSASEAIYLQLYRDLSRARAEREAQSVLAVTGKEKGWPADALFLERAHPESYGTRPRERAHAADVVLGDAAFLERLQADITDDPDGHGQAALVGAPPCGPRLPPARDARALERNTI